MCNAWHFNDYCFNNNSVEQEIKSKSNKSYYNNDPVYLYAAIPTNFTDHVNIKLLNIINIIIAIY